MITAKNYAAQACAGVGEFVKGMGQGLFNPDPSISKMASEFITAGSNFVGLCGLAQHFVMPDEGRIFEDDLKGLRNNFVRLPFNTITLEYHVKDFHGPADKGHAPKRVILANEVSREMLPRTGHGYSDRIDSLFPRGNSTAIFVISAYCQNDTWMVAPMAWLLPEKWDSEMDIDNFSQIRLGGGKTNVFGIHLPLCPSFFDIQSEVPYNEQIQDISTEVVALLEFLEAMSCTNVSTSIHQEASKANPKRARQGKSPIWETKVLTIDVPGGRSSGVSSGGTHSSPKQHLRRGHIRRLESGNIWVNSCVVGSPENGNVEKTYNIRKTA